MESVVHIHKCGDDPNLVGKSIACEIIDYSGRGLRVLTNTALVPEILLDIKISIGDPVSSFELRGEIRSTRVLDNHCHMVIKFAEDESTDLDAWVADFGRTDVSHL